MTFLGLSSQGQREREEREKERKRREEELIPQFGIRKFDFGLFVHFDFPCHFLPSEIHIIVTYQGLFVSLHPCLKNLIHIDHWTFPPLPKT